ncbi:MAG: segregation/condensation protein A [Nanobdellota archaeon]
MNDQIFDILMKEDEITWKSIIFDLVKKEDMDPWDLDISLLSKRFMDMVKKLQEMDFRIGGRVILAAAMLLRFKSNKLMDEDLNELDKLMAMDEDTQEQFYEELAQEMEEQPGEDEGPSGKKEDYRLIPRAPQPRKRKISVYDLVDALDKALEVKTRREKRQPDEAPEVKAPEKSIDISVLIDDLYNQIRDYYTSRQEPLTFSSLLPSDSVEDKVYTFIPLLHLTNQRKVDLDQKEHFGEINIHMLNEAAN